MDEEFKYICNTTYKLIHQHANALNYKLLSTVEKLIGLELEVKYLKIPKHFLNPKPHNLS